MVSMKVYCSKALTPADEGILAVLVDSMTGADLRIDRQNMIVEINISSCDLCTISYLWGAVISVMEEFGVIKIDFQYEEAEV